MTITVTDSALALIQSELKRHQEILDPVVSLAEESSALRINPKLAQAIEQGADSETVRRMLTELHQSDLQTLKTRLVPMIKSRADYVEKNSISLRGVPFCLSALEIQAMKGWSLDVRDGSLVLINERGVQMKPRTFDVARLK